MVVLTTWRALVLGGGVSCCFLPGQRIIASLAVQEYTSTGWGAQSSEREMCGVVVRGLGLCATSVRMFLLQLFRDFVSSDENIQ